jgi:hypothetical protein
MAAAANLFNDELLRSLTPAQLDQFDDETIRRLANLVRSKEYDRIDSLCAKEVASFTEGPLFWGSCYTLTENPHYKQQGLDFKAAFPQKGYFVPLFEEFLSQDRLLVPKSREMMTSWSFMLYAVFRAQWHKSDVVIQTGSLGKVVDLISYASQLYRYQHDFLKTRHPLDKETQTELTWADGGRVRAIPSGADQIRLHHPTIVIFDECAFLPEFEDCWNTAHPVAKQMIGVSSAGPGRFADMCQRRML